VIKLNRKILLTVLPFVIVLLVTPLVSAKSWDYPKNNPKFEQYGVTVNFTFANLVAATYAATDGLEEANKVVVVYEEQAIEGYQIRVGEDGPGQRVYNVGEDFAYYGVGTIVTWNPILPYAFDPTNPMMSLFLMGSKTHWRVDYMYDFGDGDGGLDGTIKLLALTTGNTISAFDPDAKTMFITSIEGTGDFSNVQVQAKRAGTGHEGVVLGWPE
jgi:hypothetical protein